MKAKVRQFRSELKSTKKGSRSISEYLLRIKAIVDSLIAIGDSITYQDHVDAILDGLPEEYGALVMMIYRRSEPPTISKVEGLLLVQEAQLDKFKQELNPGIVTVNVAQGPHRSQGSSQFAGNGDRGGRNQAG